MKVLFASLSRIGDYIQHLAVIRAWSLENSDVDVHILVNDLIPQDLVRMNSQFKHIVLPRFEYQKRINQVTTPLMYPFLSLKKLVHQLRAENYVQVIDLTYQSHSLAFLKLVQPGFSYSEKEASLINEYVKVSDDQHLIDKIKSIHDLNFEPSQAIAETANKVLFQVSTSDEKKNVDLSKWRELFDQLKSDFPSLDLFVLSSRQERKVLESVFQKSELFVCSFLELGQILDSRTRLVSLDTSVKHFAALHQVSTVEISVGSSHWIKNAAYQSGNFIFSSEFHCRPCVHSVKCPLGRNQCQDEISFSELKQFIGSWIDDVEPQIFPMKTKLRNGNLSIQRGDKWTRKISQTNPSL
jgi:ADP-heptose:LPS heptosyltransferase